MNHAPFQSFSQITPTCSSWLKHIVTCFAAVLTRQVDDDIITHHHPWFSGPQVAGAQRCSSALIWSSMLPQGDIVLQWLAWINSLSFEQGLATHFWKSTFEDDCWRLYPNNVVESHHWNVPSTSSEFAATIQGITSWTWQLAPYYSAFFILLQANFPNQLIVGQLPQSIQPIHITQVLSRMVTLQSSTESWFHMGQSLITWSNASRRKGHVKQLLGWFSVTAVLLSDNLSIIDVCNLGWWYSQAAETASLLGSGLPFANSEDLEERHLRCSAAGPGIKWKHDMMLSFVSKIF